MNGVDIAITVVVGLSIIFGVMRGFTKEAIALLAWVLACVLALNFSEPVADLLTSTISQPVIRYISAFLLICIATLILVGLIRLTLKNFIEKNQLSKADRVLGFLFGAARGIMIVGILVYLLEPTEITTQEKWYQSKLIPHFEKVSVTFISFMPSSTAFANSKANLQKRTNPAFEEYLDE